MTQAIAARTRLNLGSVVITTRAFMNLERGALKTEPVASAEEARAATGQQAQSLSHAQMLLTGATSGERLRVQFAGGLAQ